MKQRGIVPIKPPEMMNGQFDEFIGIWEDHVPKFVCDKAIKFIDDILEKRSKSPHGALSPDGEIPVMEGDTQFANSNLGRKDFSIMLQYGDRSLAYEFEQYLHACFLDYLREYGQLSSAPLISFDQKLQKTEPGGGYHVWHYEDAGFSHAHRVLVWAIYLNDMNEEEAETEFLYQKRRIRPKRGTCLIWPASYTHVHRGNPVYTQDKYILTGWYSNMV
ncbi:MAG: 2OG-Fe(II) oxygenase [Candidatus Marinimicrobia bacterium]|nr:2OG-Fe(II) oxygenase [Candidatus Neomarinimicrobiota bacterium]